MRWTLEEDEILRKYSTKKRWLHPKKLIKFLPEKNPSSINSRRRSLGLSFGIIRKEGRVIVKCLFCSNEFSKCKSSSQKFCSKNCKDQSWMEVLEQRRQKELEKYSTNIRNLFKEGKTDLEMSSILNISRAKVGRLRRGLQLFKRKRHPRWTKEEDNILKSNDFEEKYRRRSPKCLDILKGRTWRGIMARRIRLRLSKPINFWSKEEEKKLIELYPNHLKEYLAKEFPNRSLGQIEVKARILRLKKNQETRKKIQKLNCPWQVWSQKEEKKLRRLFSEGYTSNQILSFFENRTINQVRNKLYSMGLIRCGLNPWSEEEIKLLREFYPRMTIRRLVAEKLPKKSVARIVNKAKQLGLIRKDPRIKFDKEKFLVLYEQGLSDGEIAKEFNMKRHVIGGHRNKLELPNKNSEKLRRQNFEKRYRLNLGTTKKMAKFLNKKKGKITEYIRKLIEEDMKRNIK